MTRTQILPSLLILIDIGSAVVCYSAGDWRRAGYFFSAGAITFFATI